MDNNLDIRVYPLDEPKNSTLAFASVAVDDIAVIRGIRVIEGGDGLFVSMPQTKSKEDKYHDVAFPLSGDLRKEIVSGVLDEYDYQTSLHPEKRGYDNNSVEKSGKATEDVNLSVKVFPITEPKGNTLAFASVGLNDVMAIRGIRVVNGDKGVFISMPQSKDKAGGYHDVAFPLSGSLRKAMLNAILSDFEGATQDKKPSIGEQLAEGKAKAANHTAPERTSAAKRAPGYGR